MIQIPIKNIVARITPRILTCICRNKNVNKTNKLCAIKAETIQKNVVARAGKKFSLTEYIILVRPNSPTLMLLVTRVVTYAVTKISKTNVTARATREYLSWLNAESHNAEKFG